MNKVRVIVAAAVAVATAVCVCGVVVLADADGGLAVIPNPCRSCDHQPTQRLCFDCCWRCAVDACVVPCPGTSSLHPIACDECLAAYFMQCALSQCHDQSCRREHADRPTGRNGV
ncbi:MAG: hypothetical protein ACYTDW_09320 [Planctomycetota bacterium]|jgi:hypothetical protein